MLKWLKRIILGSLLLLAVLLLTATWLLRGSLPQLQGEHALTGLDAGVSVQRDALGVVTIDAASRDDAMRALGYVHAQERYFEMDLMRRTAAGELSELFGPAALDLDRSHRVHRLRARLSGHLDAFMGQQAPQLQAYTDGVNQGLAGLRVRPWPYLLLRQAPRPWQRIDSALAGYAMYFDLQDASNQRELALQQLRENLPPALYALLSQAGSEWDAPLLGPAIGNAVLPDATQVDLRRLPTADGHAGIPATDAAPGSNNWAVGGALTADGRAIIADDMHLGLRAPNIWFRVRLRFPDPLAPGGKVDVSGFSLPGLPAIIVGSNGHIAWGFTNAYADTADFYRVRPCPDGQPADTCEPVRRHREILRIKDAPAQTLVVEDTRFGPITAHAGNGDALALRWVAQLPGSLNLELGRFDRVADLTQAIEIADGTATPAQNLVLGDASGSIGWRILGPLPQRAPGCAGADHIQDMPRYADASTSQPSCPPWPIRSDSSPWFSADANHRIWTANARTVDGQTLARIGDAGYALGARAAQIRDGLFRQDQFDEQKMLALQLDDRAVFLQRWWALLNASAKAPGAGPAIKQLAAAAGHWDGRASTDSVSYRIVRGWRLAVHQRIEAGLVGPARRALGDELIMPRLPQLEAIAWPLLQQRPLHLLSPDYADWDELLESAAREVGDELVAAGPLAQRSWGERNTANICHPLARALPDVLHRYLCMPAEPLAGDTDMPRVQGPAFGASERMVVSPGHEADGIIHMPGGQSGHPLSPFWGAGHDDWVHGRATPFLPGEPVYRMQLQPGH
ncbi:penicillin acylase family protein [Pseudoxanthomonas dokdonensis]|uniref:Penicillin acylase n=1 Tax=Pseudoxanthomonas dokdonensis TaxID=344882 RepID=A0A0R0CGT7_9GAMM|nr:penicillin acylase family protein [Pseudoxanthomonas dokdonensis]KRG69021.1 penicillin acylase [Pseudoxanthomonas dokdonensis]